MKKHKQSKMHIENAKNHGVPSSWWFVGGTKPDAFVSLRPPTHPTSPVSLTNLQVSVGGQNVLQSTLQYGYEHFLEQVNLAEQLTSSDFGISTGLINQNYWENSKWYYVNVERGNAADKLNGRNINVSFTNNSNVPIEVMVFIFYSDEITIDVKTGLVTRHKN